MSVDTHRTRGGIGDDSVFPDPTAPIDVPRFPPVTDQVRAIANALPNAVAVEGPMGSLTYTEMWRAAEALAARLHGAGVEAGSRVAISGVRSADFVIAMVAVLQAGAIAVPIDSGLPPVRRATMLRESGARFVLPIHGAANDAVEPDISVLSITDLVGGNGSVPDFPSPDGPAYIYFTSGSTGVPKGILGTQQGLGQFVSWQRERFDIGPGDRVALLKGISFDAVLREVFTPLTSGATICIPPDGYEPDDVLPWVVEQGVTILHATPSHANVWLSATDGTARTALRYVFFSGEILSGTLVNRWRQQIDPPGEVVNLYGPTETTMIRTYHVIEANPDPGPQPVGLPLPYSQALVVDEDDRLCPPGERGEILLRTPFGTAGYVNAPAEAARAFVPNPYRDDPNDIVYRTGDTGLIRSDGVLVVAGRLDDQVQILGVRVEPGEVAAHLEAHPGVRRATVVARRQAGDVPYLVAYIVPNDGEVAAPELRHFLADRLIGPMIPNRFISLEAMPMTPNGKVDVAALPSPDAAAQPSLRDRIDALPEAKRAALLARLTGGGESTASPTRSDTDALRERLDALTPKQRAALAARVRDRRAASTATPPDAAAQPSLRDRIDALPEAKRAALLARLTGGGESTASPAGSDGGALRERLDALTPEQRAALATRVRDRRAASEATSPDAAGNAGTEPLSFAQERLWFLDRLNPNSPFYNVCKISRFRGPLDLESFRRSLDAVAARHDVLRTRYVDIDGAPRQVVDPPAPVHFELVDLTHLPEGRRAEVCTEAVETETERPFNLADGPVWRTVVLKMAPDEHVVVMTMHHIACDGWSFPILAGEVSRFYAADADGGDAGLAPLPIQYADYARGQRDRFEGGELDHEIEYWERQLAGTLPVLDLPTDHRRPAVQTFDGASRRFVVPQTTGDDVAALASQMAATPFIVGLALYVAFLHRYASADDVIVGVPSADRGRAETSGLIGFFVNTLALRTAVDDEISFRELVERVREAALGAYANQEIPFEQVVQRIGPERDPSRSPVFQTMFTFGMGEFVEDFSLPGIAEETLRAGWDSSKFDFELSLQNEDGCLGGSVVYNTDLFEPSTIDRMVRHFGNLARAALSDPEMAVGDLPLLDDQEAARVLHEFVGAAPDTDAPSVVEVIAGFAETTPQQTAITAGDTAVSYAELHARACGIAARLHDVGVDAGDRVAVLMDRSIDLVAVLLGTMYRGAAYIPIDAALPDERIRFILEDAAPAAIFVDDLDQAPNFAGDVLLPGLDGDAVATPVVPNPTDAAYVIYTSGSTGRPKGVVVSHRGLAALAVSTREYYGLRPDDRLLQFHSFSFDASVEEVFTTLATGATLALRSDQMLGSATRFLSAVAEAGITVLEFPTAYWHELTADILDQDLPLPSSVRMVIIGGEAARPQLVAAWKQRFDPTVTLINGYGPTEVTVTATAANLSTIPDPGARYVTIGRPFPTALAYVLDGRQRPVPVGVPGELYLGGPQVASGYLNRPELTAERFVQIPFSQNGRAYRTGDQVRWRSDGNLEYLGRIDRQVKVRGYRVEIGEIESVLLEHSAVTEAAVVPVASGGSDHGLAAIVVGSVSVAELRRFAAERLPAYMVPTTIDLRDELPRLVAGKVDVQALIPAGDAAPSVSALPDDPIVARLCEVWADLLGRPVSPGDSFFQLGGHSLLAVRLFSQIEQEWDVSLPITALFQSPTPVGLAAQLRQKISGDPVAIADSTASASTPQREGQIPLSYSQRRLWFLDQLHPGLSSYNVEWGLRLHGGLVPEALQAAFDTVVARHEVLRTRFVADDGVPFQVIDPPASVAIRHEDLRQLDPTVREARLRAIVAEERHRPFDLANDAVLRVTLIRTAEQEHALSVVAHHIATDADSFEILKRELRVAYEAYLAGEAPVLPELSVQYADIAAAQRDRFATAEGVAALDQWVRRLAGPVPVMALPTDRPRPPTFTYRGDSVDFSVPESTTRALVDLGATEGTTPFMILMAGLNALLSRYTGETDIVVGAPSTERSSVEAEALIGFFVNTLPLRTDVSGDPSFRSLLARVRDTMLDAFSHRDVPFEAIVEQLQPERDPSRSPLVQVMCAMAHAGSGPGFALPGLSKSQLRTGDHDASTKFDLTVYGFVDDGELEVSVGYYADAYERDLMERFVTHFRRFFEAAASQPDTPISQLEVLGPAERRWLVSGLNRGAQPYPGDRTIPEVFADVVGRHATDVAVSERDRTMTYRQLDEAAEAVAEDLRGAGVQPGDAVGLTAERSSGLVVAMLGALKAGAAYVPLDPTYPDERLEYMAADAGIRALVRPTSSGFSIEPVEADRATGDADSPAAYIMYTSGSTGRPKGVVIPHRAILRLVWNGDYAGLGPQDVVAHASNTAFDAATWEVWGALLNGARLEILDGDTLTSPVALATELRSRGVTAMFVTTALFNIIAREVPDAFASLDHLLFGGEAVDPGAVARVVRAGKPRRLVHVYGPTETTTFASWWEVETAPADGETVPIGLPIVNTTLHVLDTTMSPVPVGVAGELYIGGDGLALGYLGDSELTRARFVADPFLPGGRLYRSGDRVRRGRDGSIEFVGRIDRQVKLRGFRIEPGEVEAQLRRIDGITDAVVRVWRRNGDARLVAYVVPAEGVVIDTFELQETLRERLPDHMVPAHLAALEALPLNPNGKIDTNQLPEPAELHAAEFVAPQGPAMVLMAELWCDALRVERVGANDSFFDLGGHSLLAVELMAAVERRFRKAVPLSTLFDAPTLAAFTTRVVGHDDSAEADLIVPIKPGGSRFPLFCLHPGGGNVFWYQPLARYLDEDQPVLGIQARGADGRSRPHRTVEAMAAEYVEVINRAQPEGPVHLLGWSLGGLIAYETARLLENEGRELALLALLDTSFPRPTTWLARQRSYLRTLRRDGWEGVRSVVESMWANTRIALGKLRYGPRWATYVLRGKPIPPLLAGKRLTHIGLAANERYRPGEYAGVVTYFRATGPDGTWTRHPDVPWNDVAGRVDVIDVPGFHAGPGSMLEEPHLPVLAGEVEALLQATATPRSRQ